MIAAGATQVTDHVLMVRPRAFGPNAETVVSNAFQRATADSAAVMQARAAEEFAEACMALEYADVTVDVIDDTVEPVKPDAIFPNNWFSSHDDGTLVVYPMAAVNRRAERRADTLEHLHRHYGLGGSDVVDLSFLEERGIFLEGTGSLVFDRPRRTAFACLSPRTSPAGVAEFSARTGFEIVAFQARDAGGVPLYHTNVMMSIGVSFALVCLDAVDARDRALVSRRLREAHDPVIEISLAQMHEFAGNVLELATPGGNIVAMSVRAMQAFTDTQISALTRQCRPLAVRIPTIEDIGGGSLRCMLAEIFPRRLSE